MAIYDPNSNQHADGRDQFSDDVHFDESTFYVDIPKVKGDGKPSEEWYSVDSFSTREEALKFAQDSFGADENGMVSLISQS